MLEKYRVYYRTLFVVFWITMCYGFVSDELLPFLSKLKSAIFVLVDLAFLILGIICIKYKRDLYILLSFLVVSIVSTLLVNRLSFVVYFSGFREFLGLLFAMPIVSYFLTGPHAKDFKKRFDRQLFIWLCIQPFCMIWQFIKYGAGDHGGGSLGNWHSGMCSMFIYLISFYLVYQKWDYNEYWKSIKKNWIYLFLLFPSYLNETKASFIYLALYFILLYKPTKATVLKLVYIIPISIVLFLVMGQIYVKATGQEDRDFDLEYFSAYFMGAEGEIGDIEDMYYRMEDGAFDMLDQSELWGLDIPRFAKLYLMFNAIKDSKGGVFFGAGIGQFKGGTTIDRTEFYKKYPWLLIGSRPWLFYLFIQLGLLGFIWFFPTIYVQIYTGPKMRFPGNRIIYYLTFCLLLSMVYNDSLRELNECIVFFYFVIAGRYVIFTNKKESEKQIEETLDVNEEEDAQNELGKAIVKV